MIIMTPQIQQALKLLQMSDEELARYVENELAQNPLSEDHHDGVVPTPVMTTGPHGLIRGSDLDSESVPGLGLLFATKPVVFVCAENKGEWIFAQSLDAANDNEA
jgi:hypothetical protein